MKLKQKWNATVYDIKDSEQIYAYCAKQPDDCKDENEQIPTMKLCFWQGNRSSQDCVRIEDSQAVKIRYTYDTAADFKIIRLCNHCKSEYGFLLEAQNTGFDSGRISKVSIWVYDENKSTFIDILRGTDTFHINEQGEYKIFSSLSKKFEGLIVRAEAIFNYVEETRYSPHRFRIHVYKLNDLLKLTYIGSYETIKKYKSLDEVQSVNVINPEIKKIIKFIETNNGKGK
jgi:hypothetical protein